MPLNIDKFVKLPAFLQFVGLILAFIGLITIALRHPFFGWPLAIIGLGVSFAGFIYDKIYP